MSNFNVDVTLIYSNDSTLDALLTTGVTTVERPYWMNVLDKASAIIMTCNLVFLMLGMGAATHLTEVWRNIKRPWGCILGMICQIGLLPAVSFGMCYFLKFPPYESLAILILSCSPGGAFSNFFTYWVNGDIALSILMTSTSSILAFGAMPLNLWLYTRYWTEEQIMIPYVNVLISMAFVTGPAIVGMIIRHYFRLWANRISKICGVLGWVGAFTCGVFIVLIYWDDIIATTLKLLLAAALLPVLAFLIAFLLSKIVCLTSAACRTIGIETSCQNSVVALNVMLLSFSDPTIRGKMVIYPTVYAICQLAEIFVVILIYQAYKFAHRDDVTEEEVKSVIDNTVLTIVQIPMMKTNRPKKHSPQNTPDVIYSEGLLVDRASFSRMESNEKTYNENVALLRKENTSNVPETYDQNQVLGLRHANNNNKPDVKRHRRRKDSSSSSDSDSHYTRCVNYQSEVKGPSDLKFTENFYKKENLRQHPAKNQVNERPLRSSEVVNVIANNFKINFDPETYETPRSPSLNAGYSFRTFGNERSFKRNNLN